MTARIAEAAELAVAGLLARLKIAGNPPLDVRLIAHALGVDAIVYSSTPGDGRLEDDGTRRTIVLQSRAGAARQRFTLAHEVGHFYIRHHDTTWRNAFDTRDEERFCNAFAAALLLPSAWLDRRAQRVEPTLEGLRSLAEEAEVSMASCFVRLRRYRQWRRSLLRWRYDHGEWRLFATTGVPVELRDSVRTLDATRRALELVARNGPDVVSGYLWLGLGRDEAQVPAEIAVRGPGAIAMVDLQHIETFQREADVLVEQLVSGFSDPASGLSELRRATLLDRVSWVLAGAEGAWPAPSADQDLAVKVVNAAARDWFAGVLSRRGADGALVHSIQAAAPICDAASAIDAYERALRLRHWLDDDIQRAACENVSQATMALGTALRDGARDQLPHAAHAAGRVLGELVVLGAGEHALRALAAVISEASAAPLPTMVSEPIYGAQGPSRLFGETMGAYDYHEPTTRLLVSPRVKVRNANQLSLWALELADLPTEVLNG